MKVRTFEDGRSVTVHRNDGLRKRCECPRRAWPKCPHPWHFNFKWRDAHHRFPLDRYAPRHIVTKDDARAEADRLRAAIRDGRFPPTSATAPATAADLMFEKFAEKWRERARDQQTEHEKVNEGAITKRLSELELAPGERLGDRAIGAITEDDIETVFQRHLSPLAGSTWNKYRQVVLHLQRWGVKKGYLTRRWLTDDSAVARKRNAKRERRLIPDVLDDKGRIKTAGEERRLLNHASPWLQRLIIAALETGCRRGELLNLLWHDVNLTRGELTIRAENAKDGEMRHLPISPRLRGVLKMIEHDPAGKPHKPIAFVFGDRVGGKVCDPKKAWIKTCGAAEITDLHFHDLRHEAGSRMLEQGWPLHHVQEMLGHADVKTTSVYLNLTRQSLQESMKKFGMPALHDVAQSTRAEHPPAEQQQSTPAANVMVN